MRKTFRGLGTAAVVVTATLVAVPGASATPHAPKTASVGGAGEVRLTFAPDRDVRSFTFDARATPYTRPMPGAPHGLPTDATGTVRVAHRVAADGVTVRFAARVDCLVTAARTATLTAVVTEADAPAAGLVGRRLGFSVYDGPGGDRVGFSWAVVNADQGPDGQWREGTVGTCMAPAPFAPVTDGDYVVRHAELSPPPTDS
ncbi:hypothetical protein DKT68_07860 [Micromonospora acroterricola]|uniref:Repetin n=1 Tax=Micromonospora acroterricola TaxID=2202421 RepID=A0A317D9U1_9ACTN|nr:hypothetical protein [Micromonospora acroterricola]PWR10850.1 hypothetical protein DKT68_07860 [Micromonospora acroterricola]